MRGAATEETPLITSSTASEPQSCKKSAQHGNGPSLTLLPLVALIFYEVSGGPFGTESAVHNGGILYALLGYLLIPLVWSLPEALVTAELGTAFPEDAGYVTWVGTAFGEFWGYQEGIWSWFSGVADNAIYPVLFTSYLSGGIPILSGGLPRYCVSLVLSLLWALFNWFGLQVVGIAAIIMTLFVLSPFAIMVGLAVPHIHPRRWLMTKAQNRHPTPVNWPKLANVLFWNVNYWDGVSTLVGEVKNPSKILPRALMLAVILVVTTYVVPLGAATGLCITHPKTPDGLHTLDGPVCEDFCEPSRGGCKSGGYYQYVAEALGGWWLYTWLAAAAALSNFGQFEAELASDSFQLLGMAQRGMLPSIFAYRSRHGTPTFGILASSLGIAIVSALDFNEIIAIVNALYCFAQLLEFAAFVQLRISHPHLPRGFSVPLGTKGCMAMLAFPSIMVMIMLRLTSVFTFTVTLFCISLSFMSWPVVQWLKRHEIFEFLEPTDGLMSASVEVELDTNHTCSLHSDQELPPGHPHFLHHKPISMELAGRSTDF